MTHAAAKGAEVSGPEPFGKTADGTPIQRYTLQAGGVTVRLTTYGAAITEVLCPDRDGKLADVVLGFDDGGAYDAGYAAQTNAYFGCTTGRVCNRIAEGKFTLDGQTYQLNQNVGTTHLHGGGDRALSKIVWRAEKTTTDAGPGVKFTYTSPDGEEHYPGTVEFATVYMLNDRGELTIEWTATTDKATPINLTNHSYFNLAGAGSPTIYDHELTIDADRYTPLDETLLPTGKIESVDGTPLDFRKPTRIGARIEPLIPTPQIGYDHNYVLSPREPEPTFAAKLRDPASGRTLTVKTTQPGVQLYTGNFLKGHTGKGGKVYAQRSACCLETQHFPDAVNHAEFPSIIVRPGDTYRQSCVYAFGVE